MAGLRRVKNKKVSADTVSQSAKRAIGTQIGTPRNAANGLIRACRAKRKDNPFNVKGKSYRLQSDSLAIRTADGRLGDREARSVL